MITVMRFTASWCQPCKMLAPILQGLTQDFPTVKFEVIDVDSNPDMAHHFKIRNIPSVILLNKEDEILKTLVGIHSKQTYIDAIHEYQDTPKLDAEKNA